MPDLEPVSRVRTGPVLVASGLGYRYPGGDQRALAGLDLEVGRGEFLVLAGESGSGKSTLIRASCGLVPHFHGGTLEGSVTVEGIETSCNGPGELARIVGYVNQEPETQVVSTTVRSEIDLPLRFRGEAPEGRARAIEEVALALGIADLLDRPVGELSGGEVQKVALAAALAPRPSLVLLDEPTSQLDPVAGDELIWLLRRLNEEWGVTVVLAEHRLERCLAAADRVVVLEAGRKSFDGSPGAFLEFAVATRPEMATPAARLFEGARLGTLPVGVRDARRDLDRLGSVAGQEAGRIRGSGSGDRPAPSRSSNGRSLSCSSLWVEVEGPDGSKPVLRGIDLAIDPGEKVALMGRNGAGKSTLLRTAAGLFPPDSGRVSTRGGIALLGQSPADYLVRERLGDELPGTEGLAAMAAVGLEVDPDRDPRDLSGGERQRLALAIALAGRMTGDSLPDLVALDEPTRGMDRGLKEQLAGLIEDLSVGGAAVVVATHDVEFAIAFADRVVLLGDGVVVADADVGSVLSGGWYFASEVARILDTDGVVSVEQGVELLNGGDGEPAP